MLQLTRKADYALRLMVEVAAAREGPVAISQVARRQRIPYQFLRKVAQALVSRGLLVSHRRAGGGLTLARPAETISALDIVRAVGSPALNRCTADPPRCDRRTSCAVYPVWAQAQGEVERILGAASLSRLAALQLSLDRRARRRPGAGGRGGVP